MQIFPALSRKVTNTAENYRPLLHDDVLRKSVLQLIVSQLQTYFHCTRHTEFPHFRGPSLAQRGDVLLRGRALRWRGRGRGGRAEVAEVAQQLPEEEDEVEVAEDEHWQLRRIEEGAEEVLIRGEQRQRRRLLPKRVPGLGGDHGTRKRVRILS